MGSKVVPDSIKQTLENTIAGMIGSCPATDKHVNVMYYNGFEEVIWFKSEASAVIFSNAVKGINEARKLKLGETYSD